MTCEILTELSFYFFAKTANDSYLFLVGIQVDVWKADRLFNEHAWILCCTCVVEPPAGRSLTVHWAVKPML